MLSRLGDGDITADEVRKVEKRSKNRTRLRNKLKLIN